MTPDTRLPALRPIDVTPLPPENGELFFGMHDMSRVSPRSIAVSFAAYFVLAHFDGNTTLAEVQASFQQRFGMELAADEVRGLAAAMENLLFLQGPRYEAAYAERVAAYRAAPYRDNRVRWPDGDTLRTEIEQMLTAADLASPVTAEGSVNGDETPPSGRRQGRVADPPSLPGKGRGRVASSDDRPLAACAGLIAPHLDYERGGPCYAAAYAAIRDLPPYDRYVILGTNHFGRSRCVVATGKDVLTPFGPVQTDAAFIEALESRLGCSLRTHEYDHLAEHSIELQVHILQTVLAGRPFQIVPLLCPDPSGPTGTRPADGNGPDLVDFADALRDLLKADAAGTKKRTLLIASADLSHVGTHFGEPEPATPEFLARVGEWDQMLLSLVAERREAEFVQRVADARNPTRICSVGCIYALARALPDRPVRILRYHQAVNTETDTHVTCCAAVVE